MQNKHPIITYASYFISEAMIIFLLLVPVMHNVYQWVPYLSYLGIVIAMCILFSCFTKYSTNFSLYIIAAPILMFIFYVSHFPLILSVLFSVVLTWRYITIRKESFMERESLYLKITMTLCMITALFFKHNLVIVFAFLQVFILIIGYLFGHLLHVAKEGRKNISKKFWLYLLGGIIVGAFGLFIVSDLFIRLFKVIYSVAVNIIVYIASGPLYLLEFIDIDIKPFERREDVNENLFEGENEFDFTTEDGTYLLGTELFYWIIALVCFILILFLAMRFFKKKFTPAIVGEHHDDLVSYEKLNVEAEEGKRGVFQKLFSSYFQRPNHPVRKLVYQFEQKARANGKGRKTFETLDEWFTRLEFDADLNIYRKVRYGEKEVSNVEVSVLKEQLKELEEKL